MYVIYGEPISVKADTTPEEFEAYQVQLEESLLGLEDKFVQLVSTENQSYFLKANPAK